MADQLISTGSAFGQPANEGPTEALIYGLLCPIANEIRYVGKAADPHVRRKAHLSAMWTENTYKARWLRSLARRGLEPSLIILEKTNNIEWAEREQFWIKKLAVSGSRLTNSATGGKGQVKGFKHHPESVRRIGAALKKRSPEARRIAAEKSTAKQRGKQRPEWLRAKWSAIIRLVGHDCPRKSGLLSLGT